MGELSDKVFGDLQGLLRTFSLCEDFTFGVSPMGCLNIGESSFARFRLEPSECPIGVCVLLFPARRKDEGSDMPSSSSTVAKTRVSRRSFQ